MAGPLDLIEETESHFKEGARSVRAYANDHTYVITKAKDANHYWIAIEDQGFQKQKAVSLAKFYEGVFGIEASY
jgi:hypothetical protein